MDSQRTDIGQRIYDLRTECDIQQGELAKKIHLHQSVLNRIEKGLRPARDEEIRSIALHFGVSADYLLGLPSPTKAQDSSFAKSSHTEQASINAQEIALIEKFRALDERGKQAVMDTLEREYSYVEKELPKEA